MKIGLFSIGGGYATLPLIQQQAVVVHPWLTLQEFTDIITLSQMTPGPLAVNTSTFVGMRLAGMAGSDRGDRRLRIVRNSDQPGAAALLPPQRRSESRSASVGNIEIRFRRFDRGFRRNDCLDRPIRCFLLKQPLQFNGTALILFALSLAAIVKGKLGPVPLLILSALAGVSFIFSSPD